MKCCKSTLFLTGYVLVFAYDDLSKDKVANQSTTSPHGSYPPNSYVAGNAVDRNITTCMRALPIGQNSPDKAVWWKVDLGGVYSIYSVNILFKNYPGYGCEASGVYGESCTEQCPINCRDNVCHIQNGTCFGCTPGWIGTTCNSKCVGGWYGLDCKQPCSGHCRDKATCKHVTGRCDGGCAVGWRGDLCDKVCKNRTYGNNCIHSCSGNCLNDTPCNRKTGHCEGGCKPGYTNELCNKHCQPGYYGYRCENTCSGHCSNNTICDYIDGTCSDGCQPGYIGKLCNAPCKIGYYGENCSRVCSLDCKTCKPTDGTCICSAGWMGPNCSTEIKADHLNIEFNVTPVAVGGTLSAFVVLIIVVAMLLIRRKRQNKSSTSSSPYAEIKVRQSEDSTYQQLNVSISVPRLVNAYQNLSLQQ